MLKTDLNEDFSEAIVPYLLRQRGNFRLPKLPPVKSTTLCQKICKLLLRMKKILFHIL